MTALGVLDVFRSRSIRVPKDISVVGFDDLLIASYTHPPLTTVRQPKRQMGQIAMEMLLGLVSGTDSESIIKVQGELIVRESTASPKS
jgi:DNA-binding LacI/PurR family transcriptional regulator